MQSHARSHGFRVTSARAKVADQVWVVVALLHRENRIFRDANVFIGAFEGGKVSVEPLAPVRFRR